MNKTVFRLTLIKIAAAVLGMAYSVLQVRLFGATAEVDAFFVASSAVYMITSLVQGGQLAEVFLPEYLKARNNYSTAQAHRLFSAVVNRMLAAVLMLSVLAWIVAPWIVQILGPGLENSSLELAAGLFRACLILIGFTIFSSFVNTTLNAEGIFGRAELTGLVNNAISLVLIFFFHKETGIWILVFSLLSGKLVELFSGIWFLRKAGLRYSLNWSVKDYNVSGFFKVLFVTSGYVGATQIYTSVVTAAASFLPPGTLSVFNYVKLLCTKASGILITPATTVFFSGFSQKASSGKREELSPELRKPIMAILSLCLMVFAFVILGGFEMLSILWQSKSMDESQIKLASQILVLGFAGLLMSGAGGIFRKAAISIGASAELYSKWIGSQLISALFSFLCIWWFGSPGLLWILPFNMVIMALVSMMVARRHGINIGEVFALSMIPANVRWFMVCALPVIAAGLIIPLPPEWSLYLQLAVKAGGFTFLMSAVAFLLFRKEILRNKFNIRAYFR